MPGNSRDTWLEAIKQGNGKDKPPIDPDAPNDGDFEQTVANFFGQVVGQDFPAHQVWDYLQSLKYNTILEKYGDDPV